MNDLYEASVIDDTIVMIVHATQESEVLVKTPWGHPSGSITVKIQGTVIAPLKCSMEIDKTWEELT